MANAAYRRTADDKKSAVFFCAVCAAKLERTFKNTRLQRCGEADYIKISEKGIDKQDFNGYTLLVR